MSDSRGAAIPYALGLAGLVPFWALSLAVASGTTLGVPEARVAFALATYAATIVSFLGGIRWGVALDPTSRNPAVAAFGVSVVPQLVGWAALMLADPWRLLVLATAIGALGVLDLALVRRGDVPKWFGRLRLILSSGAAIALLIAVYFE